MADAKAKRPENVPGDFFVDSTCIDCGTCMWMEPRVFHDDGDMSAVHSQPQTPELRRSALRALVACPTASIGVTEPATRAMARDAVADFPFELEDGVHLCGFNSEDSFGATAYFIKRDSGNVLVDSPRFAAPLVKRIEELGGVRWMFLTHRDDIADHAKWAAKFGCKRIIHADDARGMEAEMKIRAKHEIAPGLIVYPTPGHTRGSACLHYNDKFLFTGDHMAYSESRGHLYAFRGACWYDWNTLVESLKLLLPLRFEWVLPGHGWPLHATAEEAARQMRQCVEWASAA
jgi:glyoxylase-like metal-dependent hydrolase (beta-lactamase superfamily II)/ferredoxin